MKTVSTAYQTAVASPSTMPGYLVKLGFTTPVLLSSRGTISCDSELYQESRIKVTGISFNATPSSTGQLAIGFDPDDSDSVNTVVSYALNENNGFTGREIIVWIFDQTTVVTDVLDPADRIQIFKGIGDKVSISTKEVIVSLVSTNINYLYSPRFLMNAANGFNFIIPTRIPWGDEIFILD